MALTAVVGLMGSGKSFEAVKSHILPALKAGRRVVSNIAGLSYDRIRDYLGPLADGALLERDRLVVVDSEAVSQPGFFCGDKATGSTVVLPGDLVVLDEVWRFWGDGEDLPLEHMEFLRMHRHYVDAKGQTCDVTLIIQDVASLHRKIKKVVQFTARCRKHSSLGFSKRYAVDMYEGTTLRKAYLVGSHNYRYDSAIFPLYQSYDGATAKEGQTDKRVVLWRSPGFMLGSAIGLALLLGCGFLMVRMVYGFLDGSFGQKFMPKSLAAAAPTAKPLPPVASAPPPSALPPPVAMAGYAVLPDGRTVFWIREGDNVRQVEATGGTVDGPRSVLVHEGKRYAMGL